MNQPSGASPFTQQSNAYAGMHSGGTMIEGTPRSAGNASSNPFAQEGPKIDLYREGVSTRAARMAPSAPGMPKQHLRDVSPYSALAPCGENASMADYSGNLKAEMELRKEELNYLDVLASQKEAEYEKVVHMRTEKLRILTQLENRYRKSTEQAQHFTEDELKLHQTYSTETRPPSNEDEKGTSKMREEMKTQVDDARHMTPSSVGSGPRKPSPDGGPSLVSRSSPAQQGTPGLVPYPVQIPPARPAHSLAPHASIPMSVPLIGTGLFNVRSLDVPRDLSPASLQAQNASPASEHNRQPYAGNRGKIAPAPPTDPPKHPVKRKPSQPELERRPQDLPNGAAMSGAQHPAYPKQSAGEFSKAPVLQPQHPQWQQSKGQGRELPGVPPNFQHVSGSAFQSYHAFPHSRFPLEGYPLPPNLPNVAWNSYAEALQERYALQLAKQGLYRVGRATDMQERQRVEDVQTALTASRERQKRLEKEDYAHHQVHQESQPPPRLNAAPAAQPGIPRQEPQPHPQQRAQVAPATANKLNSCGFCGQYAMYMCSGCQNIWYCGPQCQKNNWVNHSHMCQGSKR